MSSADTNNPNLPTLLSSSSPAIAQSTQKPTLIINGNAPLLLKQKIAASLTAKLPDLSIEQINQTPLNDIFEIVSGRKIFYLNAAANYLILGNLVDLDTKKSITKERMMQLTEVNWAQLPLNIALHQTIGLPKRRIAVFTDIDCPFCKRLETDTLSKLHDTTIYYFLFPMTNLHANSGNDAKRVLCSNNPIAGYLLWMQRDTEPQNITTCTNAKQLAIMQRVGRDIVGVEATPTIVLPNGNVITGLMPVNYLNKLIDEAMSLESTTHN